MDATMAAHVKEADNDEARGRLAVALAIVQARRRAAQCEEWKERAELAQEQLKASQAALKILCCGQGISKLQGNLTSNGSSDSYQLQSIVHAVASECSKSNPSRDLTHSKLADQYQPGLEATLAQLHSITTNTALSTDNTLVRQKLQGLECLLRHVHIIQNMTQHSGNNNSNYTSRSASTNSLKDLTSFVTDVLVRLPHSALQQAYTGASLTVLSAALFPPHDSNQPQKMMGSMLCKLVSKSCNSRALQEHKDAKCLSIADNTLRVLCAMLQYPSLGLFLLSVLAQQLLGATQQHTQHLMRMRQMIRKQNQAHGDAVTSRAELLSTVCRTQMACASILNLVMQCVDKLPIWLHSVQEEASFPCSDEYGAVSQSQRQTQTTSQAIKGTATDNLWAYVHTATEGLVESYALSTTVHNMAAQRLKLQSVLAKLAVSLQHVGLSPGNEARVMQACQLLKHAMAP